LVKNLSGTLLCALSLLGPVGCADPEARPQSEHAELVIGPHAIEIAPTREDLVVASLWIQMRCARHPEEGSPAGPDPGCLDFSINGRPVADTEVLELAPGPSGRFQLERQKIRYRRGGEAHLCIALRPVFEGVSHQKDAEVFARAGDRYSILSYCDVERQPEWVQGRFSFEQNLATSVEDFRRALERPIVVPIR
jgi:hypothetical protein